MLFPLLIVMIAIMIWDHIQDGESFLFFTRMADWYNSFKGPGMSKAQRTDDCMFLEYKAGKDTYGLLIPSIKNPRWQGVVAVTKTGQELNVTDEFRYFAGPYRNFHGLPLKPLHINSEYVKVGFVFSQEDVVQVKSHEVILIKFKEREAKLKE